MSSGIVLGILNQSDDLLTGRHCGFVVFAFQAEIDDLLVAGDAVAILFGGLLEGIEGECILMVFQHILGFGVGLLRLWIGGTRLCMSAGDAETSQKNQGKSHKSLR